RLPKRDTSAIALVVIVRLPSLIAIHGNADGRVEQQRSGCGALRGDGCEISEGLEGGAWLAPHARCAVEWREVVIGAADQRAHSAAAWINRQNRCLQRLVARRGANPGVLRFEL